MAGPFQIPTGKEWGALLTQCCPLVVSKNGQNSQVQRRLEHFSVNLFTAKVLESGCKKQTNKQKKKVFLLDIGGYEN